MSNGGSASNSNQAMLTKLRLLTATREHWVMKIKNGLPAIHPGEFLQEILEELGSSQAECARAIGVSPMRISHVIKGDRPVTAELALLLGRVFGQSPEYWLNLQSIHDLKIAQKAMGNKLRSVRQLAAA